MQKPWRWWRDSPRYLHIGGPWSFSSWDHAERFFWSIDLHFFHTKNMLQKKIVIKKFVRICVQYHAESVYIREIERTHSRIGKEILLQWRLSSSSSWGVTSYDKLCHCDALLQMHECRFVVFVGWLMFFFIISCTSFIQQEVKRSGFMCDHMVKITILRYFRSLIIKNMLTDAFSLKFRSLGHF